MILSAQSIRWRVVELPQLALRMPDNVDQKVILEIIPFCERTVAHGMSYGLSACGYDLRIKDALTLAPGGFALATTVEWFSFPADLRGTLADKSTWARRGIAVQNTRFEPGWRGYPTIEISNHGQVPVEIPAGAPIAQMEFALLDQPTDQLYAGKYQDQPQVSIEAKEEGS